MDCSFNYELNFYDVYELTSLKESFSHDVWKEAMKEYDALIMNGT